ncbi:MAG: Crp/Fnr family transcriptional regulator [Oscillospiraceae bacterium]|jgi:CRP-like cAMP-binding protein|nr:Crp/Fnr family transcriptional regulator [Oscillospiraceae bacterium]
MDFGSLERLDLFRGVSRAEITRVCGCLRGEVRNYAKGEAVIREGDSVRRVGVVLKGRARSVKTGVSGRNFTVALLNEGSYIGVLLAFSSERKSHVTVEATERLSVLFLPASKLIGKCEKSCPAHDRVIYNVIEAVSEKALLLHERNDCLIKNTVREKTLTFLTRYSEKEGAGAFEIPFDREGMAEYLNVDRSALSRELSRMKKEKIIDFYKNTFKILTKI